MRRVRRSDGVEFESLAEAIRITHVERFGYPCPNVSNFMPAITNVCRGRYGAKSALGYSWEYADELTKQDLVNELSEVKAKLDRANERLKSNGLEVVA